MVHRSMLRVVPLAMAGVLLFSPQQSIDAQTATQTLDFGTAGGTFNLQCISGGAPVNFASYGGFTFTGLRSAQPSQFTGRCAATNSGLGSTASIMAMGGGAFQFQSARFADAFPTGSTTITLAGFLGATQVFTNTLTLGSSVGAGLLFTNTMPANIDRLTIVQTGPDPFALDDFTTSAATVVPEPSTWALFAAGLAVLVPMARRRRNA